MNRQRIRAALQKIKDSNSVIVGRSLRDKKMGHRIGVTWKTVDHLYIYGYIKIESGVDVTLSEEGIEYLRDQRKRSGDREEKVTMYRYAAAEFMDWTLRNGISILDVTFRVKLTTDQHEKLKQFKSGL